MKIIISLPDFLWDIKMDCFSEYQNDIILLQFEKMQEVIPVFSIDVHVESCSLGQGPGTDRGERQYIEVKKHLTEIINYISKEEDVLVLADTNPQGVIIFDLLRRVADGKNFKLHFWGIVPFRFESRIRKLKYLELLYGNGGRVKSMYIKEADDYLKTIDRRTTMPQVLKMIKEDFELKFPFILDEISRQEQGNTYFFDNQSNQYVDALVNDKEKNCEFEDLLRTKEGWIPTYRPFAIDKELIEQPVIRGNGKEICRKLRDLRQEFAKANKIPFISKECSHEGPCAGTCAKCDAELKYLYKMMEEKGLEKRCYPHVEIEKEAEAEHSSTVSSKHMMGYLRIRDKSQKIKTELPGIQIPEFLIKRKIDREGDTDE